jgi:DNA repair exonuclease SbcCD ATPase subunit
MQKQILQGLQEWNNSIERRKGERAALIKTITTAEEELEQVEENIDLYQKVGKVYQLASAYARNQGKGILEKIVTSALRCVYEEEISLKIEINEQKDKASAEMLTVTVEDGQEYEDDPRDGDAGGVADVVSLASRIALLETVKPREEAPLQLDEPGKHLGSLNRCLAPFLTNITKAFNRQIIMVTHDPYLAEAAETSFIVTRGKGNNSIVTKM